MTYSKKIDIAKDKIQIFDNFHLVDILEDLYLILNNVFVPPSTFYIENKFLTCNNLVSELEEYLPRPLAIFIKQHLIKIRHHLNIDQQASGGWEFWSRVSTQKSPSFGYLHIDNDELLRKKTGKLLTPVYGSIFYVGPRYGIEGGETAFLTESNSVLTSQMFTSLSKDNFSHSLFEFITPKSGRLVTFKGNLPHAVMWTQSQWDLPRVTFLANYWEHRISSVPTGVCSISSKEYNGEI